MPCDMLIGFCVPNRICQTLNCVGPLTSLTDSTPPNPDPGRLTNKRLAIILLGTVAILVVANFYVQSTAASGPPQWAFVGAYADYYGSGSSGTSFGQSLPYTYSIALTVVSYNSTEAKIHMVSNSTLAVSDKSNASQTIWVSFAKDGLIRVFGGNGTYVTSPTVVQANGEFFPVTAYIFENADGSGGVTVYTGSLAGFPVGLTSTSDFSDFSASTYLYSTNIPGLIQ